MAGNGGCPGYAPIAIVGMACRLPGSINTTSKLWDALLTQRSLKAKLSPSRFNVDGFYDSNSNKPETYNAAEGYFLDEDIWAFDNDFFGINNLEAQHIDPQQRALLEVTYESLESAGIPLSSISGSMVGCYVASFTYDFETLLARKPQHYHRYTATGSARAMLANRLSHAFDFTGPSVSVDTACSSSSYALHMACRALQNGECTSAIVAGSNLIQSPDLYMKLARAQMLSGTSTCHAFDESADGYSRAEGIASLYIKKLDDAIRDGDPIRAVVRGSAINSNGKSQGVTLPSAEGQQAVINKAFEVAGLPIQSADYIEAHGTGTQIGDTIEVNAIAAAFTPSSAKPLLIGSVKTSLGHGEGVSGLNSVLKVALSLEHGILPPTMGVKQIRSELSLESHNIQVVTSPTNWPKSAVPRASINSFGFGGANGHIILEKAPVSQSLLGSALTRKIFVLCLSAGSQTALLGKQQQIESYPCTDTASLEYTLSCRRELLAARSFAVVKPGCKDISWKSSSMKEKVGKPFVFVFNGQGSQWPGMAKSLLQDFEVFQSTILRLEQCLESLSQAPAWSLQKVLRSEYDNDTIHHSLVAQTASAALQIGLVNLLRSINVIPTTTIGHSSGEIVAAYAAGFVTERQAILLAYYRGVAVSKPAEQGAMAALGLGELDAKRELQRTKLEAQLTIACINSPASVTISGPAQAVDELVADLTRRSIFVKKLATGGNAYHSPLMHACAEEYRQLLESLFDGTEAEESQEISLSMVSSLFGCKIMASEVRNPEYWVQNLTNPILFQSAMTIVHGMGESSLLEIGPHSAMRSAIKDIYASLDKQDYDYHSLLQRNRDSSTTFLEFLGDQFISGRPELLRSLSSTNKAAIHVLNDLPTYPWDHDKSLGPVFGIDQEYLARPYPRHELLGSQVLPAAGACSKWENVLRLKDIPWLKDHRLSDTIVFPAAGYISMAVEAFRQLQGHPNSDTNTRGYHLHDLQFRRFLIFASNNDAIQVVTEMKAFENTMSLDSENQFEFKISSVSKDGKEPTSHASGMISIPKISSRPTKSCTSPNDFKSFVQESRSWYHALEREGLSFGASFQRLKNIATDNNKTIQKAICNVSPSQDQLSSIQKICAVHPTLIDAAFQLSIIALSAGSTQNLQAKVPDAIESLVIRPHEAMDMIMTAQAKIAGVHTASASATMFGDKRDVPIIDMNGFHMTTYRKRNSPLESSATREAMLEVVWKPDISTFDQWDRSAALNCLRKMMPEYLGTFVNPSASATAMLLDLACHKASVGLDILILGIRKPPPMKRYKDLLRWNSPSQRANKLSFGKWTASGVVKNISQCGLLTGELNGIQMPRIYDIVVVTDTIDSLDYDINAAKQLVGRSGRIFLTYASGLDDYLEHIDRPIYCPGLITAGNNLAMIGGQSMSHADQSPQSQPLIPSADSLCLIYKDQDSLAFVKKVLSSIFVGRQTLLVEFDKALETHIPADTSLVFALEVTGPFFATMSSKDLSIIQQLGQSAATIVWLQAAGYLDGSSPDLSLAKGVGRTLMMEQPRLRFHVLDLGHPLDAVSYSHATDSLLLVLKQSRNNEFAETEHCLHNGLLHISRFVPFKKLNSTFNSQCLGHPIICSLGEIGSARLMLDAPTSLSQMYFSPCPRIPELGEDELEIQVKAFGLNAKDYYALRGIVDTLNGTRNLDHAGVVSRIGSRVQDFTVGDRVAACSPNKFSTFVVVPEWACVKLLDSETYVTAATIPVVFATALHAIDHQARAQSKESILIHAAAGGVGIAAIQLAQHRSLNIYATAGTLEKRAYLINNFGLDPTQVYDSRDESWYHGIMKSTAGNGVDIVLNSLTGDSARRSWELCAQFGRFIDISKTDFVQGGKLPMKPFLRSATYSAFDLSDLYYSKQTHHKQKFTSLLKDSLDMVRSGIMAPVQPLHVFDASKIAEAFKEFANPNRYGKIAISLEDSSAKLRYVSKVFKTRFNPNKAYFLVGGLGGLGQSLSRYMVQQGARYLAFLSRSGADRPSAQKLISDLENLGASIEVFRGDVVSKTDIFHAIDSIRRPIGGIIHAAMGLDEALFLTQMTIDKWNKTIEPKVQGAWNLHNAIKHRDQAMDFLLLISSVSGSVGTATESGYCAANAFLDSFAHHRNSRGFSKTISVGLGMIREVGYLHEHPEIEAMMLRKGVHPYGENEMLHIIDVALSSLSTKDSPSHILTGLETQGIQKIMEQGFDTKTTVFTDPRCSILARRLIGSQAKSESREDVEDQVQLFKNLLEQRKTGSTIGDDSTLYELGVRVVAMMLANLLLLPVDTLHATQKLSNFTMDSMLAAEFRGSIFNTLALDVPFGLLLNPATDVQTVSLHLIAQVSTESAK